MNVRPIPRPSRPRRLDLVFSSIRPFYFVTFNTYKRLPLLARDEVHECFRSFCARAEERNVAVGRYVIMPEHVHLFVAIPDEVRLRNWIQMLKTVLGKELLRSGAQKPHWQEGFFDHLLRSAESYSEKWDYVRTNPVRAGLCNRAEEWAYQGEMMTISY